VVLLALSQQDLTAAIQSDTVITGKQSCLCLHHIPDIQEYRRMRVSNFVQKSGKLGPNTCDKTFFQNKAMSHTQVFEWLHYIKDERISVESDECFGHP